MTRLCVSVDVEGDLPGIVSGGGDKGMHEGLPRVLALFDELSVMADFFFLASIAKAYPDLVLRVAKAGHGVGNHGLNHEILCAKPLARQRQDILDSTDILEKVSSVRPMMFRAPNFSVNGATLRTLERAGYLIDSSVLPGRYMNRFRLLRVYDHRGAPREPHRAVHEDGRSGVGGLLEIPVTENPLQPMTPIGLGALNRFGPGPLVEFLRTTTLSTVVFLIHPWEAIDLASEYPDTPRGYANVCSSDIRPLRDFLEATRSIAEFSTLAEVAGLKGGG
jgi:hypothetical protein